MASQQKLRSFKAWQRYGGIPQIRRGASVFTYSPGSLSKPDTSFGAPSMHPCTLDDPLEQQKTRVCWNDMRAVWESAASYVPAGDELLIRFEVLPNKEMNGRCYGIFYSPSANRYVAALREDVTRFLGDPFSGEARERVAKTAALVLPMETEAEIARLQEVEAQVERTEAEVERVQRSLLRVVPVEIQDKLQKELARPPYPEWFDGMGKLHPAESPSAYQHRVERFIVRQLSSFPEWLAKDVQSLLKHYRAVLNRRDEALEQMSKVMESRQGLVQIRGKRDAALLRLQRLRAMEERRARLFDTGYALTAPVRPGEAHRGVFPMPSQAPRALPPVQPMPAVPSEPATRPSSGFSSKADLYRRVSAAKKLEEKAARAAAQAEEKKAGTLIPPAKPEREAALAKREERKQADSIVSAIKFLLEMRELKNATPAQIEGQRKDLLERYDNDAALRRAVFQILREEKVLRDAEESSGGRVDSNLELQVQERKALVREKLREEAQIAAFWKPATRRRTSPKRAPEPKYVIIRDLVLKKTKDQLDGLRGMTRSTGPMRRLWEL